ncbi:hypothetical protein SBA4_6780005 [Candidatus Sulfopaludibacter sp. SbA4]|nr:hypothetical protein SBA4_6780005 [Candidatus Sulfopaludibacter sp. SbA4]
MPARVWRRERCGCSCFLILYQAAGCFPDGQLGPEFAAPAGKPPGPSGAGPTTAQPDLYTATGPAFPCSLCYHCPQFRAPGSALATANYSLSSSDDAAAFSKFQSGGQTVTVGSTQAFFFVFGPLLGFAFSCAAQEVEDVFLKIRSGIDVCLVQERCRAARLDFPGDLLCNPRIEATVADEDQSLCCPRRLIGIVPTVPARSTRYPQTN